MGNQYTVDDAEVLKTAVVAKWKWLKNTRRLENVNEKGRLALFDRCLKDAWMFLCECGSEREIPLDLLAGALRMIRWSVRDVDVLLRLREKEAAEAMTP